MPFVLFWLSSGLCMADSSMYQRMATLVSDRYLLIDELDVEHAFIRAAEEAEGDVPWLIVEPGPDGIQLAHGLLGDQALIPYEFEGEPKDAILDLPEALFRLDKGIRAIDAELPTDVDLSVTLLKGVARGLDRNSTVMAKDRLERFDERIRGRLTGIGARIGQQDGELVVREVFSGAPSEVGGLRAGDIILRVDGISTIGMNVSQSVSRIRGEEDTEVVLEVRRLVDGGSQVLEIRLIRAVVIIPNVSWELLSTGAGYISIDNFSEQTTWLMEEAVQELMAQNMEGLIIDLRGNSGGSMKQSCQAADLFMEEGVVLSTQGRDGKRVANLMREYSASPSGNEPQTPIVVLMDHSSASASEILAGVLREHDRALLIGERSHGKGTVQKVYTLRPGDDEDRVRLKLTVAEYRVAGHLPIESRVGLAPDLYVDTAVFGREGVHLPRPAAEGRPHLVHVDELPGWQGQALSEDPRDFLRDAAERIVLSARSAHPVDMASAMEEVEHQLREEEDRKVIETFGLKEVDWSRAAETQIEAAPAVELELIVREAELLAGNEVEIVARLMNVGTETLFRGRIELITEESSPWDGLTIPIGLLEPGAVKEGSRILSLDVDEPHRVDAITPLFISDGAPSQELAPVDMEIRPIEVPHVSIDGRLEAVDGHHRVQLSVQNLSEGDISGMTLRLGLKDDSPVEILDAFSMLENLPAGEVGELSLGVRLEEPRIDSELELELRVDAEFFGRILQVPIHLSMAGDPSHVELPQIVAEVPPTLPVGIFPLVVEAQDDSDIDSVVIWLDGEKVGWHPGDGSTFSLEMPLQIDAGYHRLYVQVSDLDGARKTELYRFRGEVL